MTYSMLMAAIAKERRNQSGYSHIMVSPDDFRALIEKIVIPGVHGPGPLFFAGYRLDSCDALTEGQVLFHSPDKLRTLLISTR